MRRQLRPFWPDDKIAEIYAGNFEHTNWDAHRERVGNTVGETINVLYRRRRPDSIVDLAAGDGAIAQQLGGAFDVPVILGDITPRYNIVGPIELTLDKLEDDAGLLVMTEILEHVKDPDLVLTKARLHANMLLLSTPMDEDNNGEGNEEHYWSWGQDDIFEMLREAGWDPLARWNFTPTSDDYYTFQNWIAI